MYRAHRSWREINQEKSESLRVNEGVQMTSVYEAGNDAVGITLNESTSTQYSGHR